MTKMLEKAPEKIQKICNILKKETIEPAREEAEAIIADARIQAAGLLKRAQVDAEELIAGAKQEIARERSVFQSALSQSAKQALEFLRQSIEKDLFHPELQKMVDAYTTDPKVIVKMIQAIVDALEKEGIESDLSVIIPKAVSAQEVNQLLTKNVIEKLKEKSVVLGGISGGVQVKVLDKQITLDISDAALKDLLAAYVRKDFRKVIFST